VNKRLLKDLRPGEKGSVLGIEKGSDLRKRLLDMGVVRGAEIEVVRLAPLGDPMEVLIKGYNLTLRREEAAKIHVQIDQEG
jgi:ferrous iron transport protein A